MSIYFNPCWTDNRFNPYWTDNRGLVTEILCFPAITKNPAGTRAEKWLCVPAVSIEVLNSDQSGPLRYGVCGDRLAHRTQTENTAWIKFPDTGGMTNSKGARYANRKLLLI